MSEAKIKLRVDGAGNAKTDIQSVADKFDSLADSAKGAFGGLAAGLSAGALVNWVKSAIDAADNLNDLSKSTAISVEQLAGLEAAAKKSGGELDSVASSINKLSVNMGKDAEKFAKLGITAKEPLEAFKQLADVYKSIEDPQRRAAFAADALGKSWEGAAPLLNEGGKAIGEMVEKGTRLSGVTQQLADDSDKFNDSLVDLSTAATGLKMKIASDLLPGMSKFLETVTFAYQETGKLETAWVALGGLGALAFTDEFDSDTKKLQNLRQEITDFTNEQIAREKTYGIDGVFTRFLFGGYSAEGLAQQITYLKYEAEQLAKKIEIDSAPKPPKEPARPPIGAGEGGNNSNSDNEAARLIKARTSFIDSLEKEYQTLGKTTEQNKLYEASLLGIKGRQLDLVKAKLVDIEAQKSLIKETERWNGIAKSMADEQLKYMQSMDASLDSLKSQVDAQREYNDSLGLSQEALVEIGAVKLEDLAIGKEKNAQMLEEIGLETGQIEILRQQATELRTLAQLKRDGFKKEEGIEYSTELTAQSKRDFDKMQDQAQKFTDSLYDGLSDSLYRGFESGKGFFQSFWDGIKNLFKTTVLKLAVQTVMSGAIGFGAVGQAAAASSGADSAVSSYSAGKTLWDGFAAAGSVGGGIATGLGGTITGLGNLVGSQSIAAFGSGLGMSTAAAGEAAALYGAAGNTAVAGGLTSGASIGSALAAIPGWGWAALAAAAVATKFGGGKDRVTGDQNVSGMLGTNDISRNVSWTKDGGWFNADTAGTWKYNLANSTAIADNGKSYQDAANTGNDSALLKTLNDTYASLKASSSDYAKALGLDASAIAGRADAINFALGKTKEENDKAIATAFGGIADTIALDLLPTVKDLAKENETASSTLARVALSFGTVNQAFGDLGLKLYDIGAAGYAAAANFTDLVGGIDSLKSVTASYYQNFYTQEERNANVVKSLTAELEKQNLILPSSRDGYRALVEEVSKTGSPEQLASLFKLSDAFASVFDGADKLSSVLPIFVNSAMSLSGALETQFAAQRKVEVAAIAATQALEAQAKATATAARAEAQKAYDDNLQGRLRSGKVGEIMSSNYELNPVDFGSYVSGGQFDAGGFNAALLRQKAKLSLDLIAKTSADAINVDDVSAVMQELFSFTKDRDFGQQVLRNSLPKTGLAKDISYVMFDFIESAIEGVRLKNYSPSGDGVVNVINAQDQIGYQSNLQSQYARSLSSASEALRLGIVTHEEYSASINLADEMIKKQTVSQEILADRLKQAGIDSIAFYFDQIGLSVERLNEAAEKAAEPLAVVTSAIGRFTSISDVFSLSAKAAGDVGGNADLVSQSAKIAAQVLTTQSAAQAAKELATKASFSGQSASQLRDFSLLIEGVKQFDPNSFESGFLRISDALNTGAIDQAQYQDLFSASMDMFNGVESESSLLAKTMGNLRASMSSFSDSLLIDKSKTTLSDSARMQEVMRQYDAAKIGAMSGDASSISLFQSLGSQLASKENYSSRAEANYGFSRVLADSEMLVRYADQKTTGEKQIAAIQNLEKSSNERMDRQFAILLAQLKELQDSNVNQVRAELPA